VANLPAGKSELDIKRQTKMAVNNDIYTIGFFSLPAILGSIASLFLATAAAWAIIRIVLRHITLVKNTQIRFVAWAFLAYPLSEFMSFIVNQRGMAGLIELGGSALFISILPVASRLLVSSAENIAASAAKGAACAGFILTGYCLVEIFIRQADRPEAGLGNPNVLAVFALITCCLCLSLVSLVEEDIRKWIYFGAFFAFNAMILSGSRAVWMTAPIALFVAALPLRGLKREVFSKSTLFLSGIAALLLLSVGAKIMFDRVSATVTSFQQANVLTTDVSIAQRLFMWHGGFEQFKASWLFGYGPDSPIEMINALGGNPPLTFTHYHNFLLTGAIRGGIIEVLALLLAFSSVIWFVFQKSQNQTQHAGKAIVASIGVAAFIPGLAGVLFSHDILNAVFLYSIIVGLSLGIAPGKIGKAQ
jgi:O-antigen ligase